MSWVQEGWVTLNLVIISHIREVLAIKSSYLFIITLAKYILRKNQVYFLNIATPTLLTFCLVTLKDMLFWQKVGEKQVIDIKKVQYLYHGTIKHLRCFNQKSRQQICNNILYIDMQMFNRPIPEVESDYQAQLSANNDIPKAKDLFQRVLNETDKVIQHHPRDFTQRVNKNQLETRKDDVLSSSSQKQRQRSHQKQRQRSQRWKFLYADNQAVQQDEEQKNKPLRKPKKQLIQKEDKFKHKFTGYLLSDVFNSFLKYKRSLTSISWRLEKAANNHGADVNQLVAYFPPFKDNHYYNQKEVKEFLLPKKQEWSPKKYATIQLMVVFLMFDYEQIIKSSLRMKQQQSRRDHEEAVWRIQQEYEKYIPEFIGSYSLFVLN